MDSKLLKDWLNFCEGRSKFESDHFYWLFFGGVSEAEAEQIFSTFDQQDLLSKHLLRLMGSNKAKIEGDRLKNVKMLVITDVEEKRKFCEKISDNDLVSYFNDSNIEFLDKNNYFYRKDKDESWPMRDFLSLFTDFQVDSINEYNIKIAAIVEAIYGATNDYNIVWYVLSPISNANYNFEPYLKLWENGVEYFIDEKGIFIWDSMSDGIA